jgi:hypothetical protein
LESIAVAGNSPPKIRSLVDTLFNCALSAGDGRRIWCSAIEIAFRQTSSAPQKNHAKTQTEMLRSALTFIESNTIIRSQNEQMIDATRIWLGATRVSATTRHSTAPGTA